MSNRKLRDSNIELLRILAACGVIVLHYNNARIGGGYDAVNDGSLNQMIMTILESVTICAVNLYVLISGFFMRDSMKRDLLKPIGLLTQLIVWETIFCLVKELSKGNSINFNVILNYLTPTYWFVFVYIALYLISPYINLVWKRLDDRNKNILLIIWIGLFAVYAFIPDMLKKLADDKLMGASTVGLEGSQAGYTIVNFVLMYLLGCWLRDREDKGIKNSTGKLVLLFFIDAAVIFGLTYLDKLITGDPIYYTIVWNYENPLVIIEAVLAFMIFKNLKIGNNKVINRLAAASFPSYLIHVNLLEYCGIRKYVTGNTGLLILHIICSTAVIYIISFLLNMIYDLAFRPLFSLIEKHWKNRTYSL